MGEGAGALVLKRLSDAMRDGDTIHAVIRGVGGSSDGRGKGITAPAVSEDRFKRDKGERIRIHMSLQPSN